MRVDRSGPDEPRVRLRQVLWSEPAATEMVDRLNALERRKVATYFWQPVSVARREAGTPATLTPDDRDKLLLARLHGVLDTERPIRVFFSFIFNREGRSTPAMSSKRSARTRSRRRAHGR
jgi:hypothetical protein